MDFNQFVSLNESEQKQCYEEFLKQLEDIQKKYTELLEENKELKESNAKLLEICTNSAPTTKVKELEENIENLNEENQNILQELAIKNKENSSLNFQVEELNQIIEELEIKNKEKIGNLNTDDIQIKNGFSEFEKEKYEKEIEKIKRNLLENEVTIEELVAENSRLMIEIYNFKNEK